MMHAPRGGQTRLMLMMLPFGGHTKHSHLASADLQKHEIDPPVNFFENWGSKAETIESGSIFILWR